MEAALSRIAAGVKPTGGGGGGRLRFDAVLEAVEGWRGGSGGEGRFGGLWTTFWKVSVGFASMGGDLGGLICGGLPIMSDGVFLTLLWPSRISDMLGKTGIERILRTSSPFLGLRAVPGGVVEE